ncbi:MAG: iron-containing alcohol dehydrogenase [Planctomycetes bacterium]|nr:iron-containing alcohol dehydrogenase [Planctomycetota bacterium]
MTAERAEDTLPSILSESRTRAVFGPGKLAELGSIAKSEGASRVLLVTDPGIVRAGHVERAVRSLRDSALDVTVFDGVAENPTTEHVTRGVEAARKAKIDFLVGLGGGSSMDCAKGVNFILTNGGQMADYWGRNKATKPMLPMIAVPTTAGTGSEAQSFALITDPVTQQKMACGDVKAACRVALLDPELTATQPREVAAATAIDAVAHAVETAGTLARNDVSLEMTREAWKRLDAAFEPAMRDVHDAGARADMLLGAHLGGAAIEQSMLGAAHSCANPLTARHNLVHGVAVGVMLPHVVRFNAGSGHNPYSAIADDGEVLAKRIEAMLRTAGLPTSLAQCGVPEDHLAALAAEAAKQWTAQFNPRKVTATELHAIYRSAHTQS